MQVKFSKYLVFADTLWITKAAASNTIQYNAE